MLALAISHNIFLTKDERYALASGETVEAVGVSVPVWFFKGNTSEPATEVFCKYTLTNLAEDYPVTSLARGYKFNVPQVPPGYKIPNRPPPEDWAAMSNAERDGWLKTHVVPLCSRDLLDAADGGVGYLRFKRYNKIKENGRRLNQIHIIDISPAATLESSLSD